MLARGDGGGTGAMMGKSFGGKGQGGKGGGVLFKADGTAIRNPAAFVAGIEKNGYTDKIFDANGQVIRDPVKYVASMK